MDQYTDILQKFNDFKIAYHKEKKNTLSSLNKNLLPEIIIYNKDSVIGFFKCSDAFEVKKINQYQYFDHDEKGYSKLYDILQYFELLKENVDEDKAKIIMNLFFNIRSRFSEFHNYWTDIIPNNKPLLLYCGILCNSKDEHLVDDSLNFIYSSYNFKKSYKDDIKKENIGNYTVFLIDISTFYHMTNVGLFAFKKSFINKLVFTKGDKHEVIGKNRFDAQDAPDKNLLHPDSINKEQKAKIGLVYKKTLEFAKSKKI